MNYSYRYLYIFVLLISCHQIIAQSEIIISLPEESENMISPDFYVDKVIDQHQGQKNHRVNS